MRNTFSRMSRRILLAYLMALLPLLAASGIVHGRSMLDDLAMNTSKPRVGAASNGKQTNVTQPTAQNLFLRLAGFYSDGQFAASNSIFESLLRTNFNAATALSSILPANNAPVAQDNLYSTSKNTTLTVEAPGVLANDTDADGDGLDAVLMSNPSHGNLTLNHNGRFVYVPNNNYTGTDSFTYKANDGQADSNVVTVFIKITIPAAMDDSYTVAQNTSLNVPAPGALTNDADPEGDALTAILVTNPAHGTLTLNTDGSFTYTPTTDYFGSDSFTYKANDGHTDSNIATVNINVYTIRVVTKTEDTNDGVCDADCSLREAIAAADSGDTISFASPLFDSPQTITLSDAAGFQSLGIGRKLTIIGKGANLLTIRRSPNANAKFRVFALSTEEVFLSGMTITGGDVVGNGGGISVFDSSLTITDCYITGNTASEQGGGIYNRNNTLTIINSTISNNTASSSDLDGGGGGIYKQYGLMAIINSTISGNVKNNGENNGGGIYAFSTLNTVITNSTITDNQAAGANCAGGVYAEAGEVDFRNTIIATNRNNSTVPDVASYAGNNDSGITSLGYNFVGNNGGLTTFHQPGDQSGQPGNVLNPLLDPLGNYGGSTPAHRLQSNSPAIDKGKSFGSTTDQRGGIRPLDNPAIANASGGDGSDIGAFEAPIVLTVTKTADTNDGVCDADCSLREAIAAAVPNTTIEFASPLFDSPQTMTLSDAAGFRELFIGKSLTINGKGANLLTIRRAPDAAANFRIFNVNGAAGNVAVTLNGMTVTGGNLLSPNIINSGGGIFSSINYPSLTISSCYITGNTTNSRGGGVYNGNGTLTITNSTISNNTANGTAANSDGGGGIDSDSGNVSITNSTISGNVKHGGDQNGGGLVTGGGVSLIITSSTITDNQADGANSASGFYSAAGTFTVRNTIIAGNRNNSTAPDVKGTFLSQGYNLIGNVGTASGFNQTGDQTGTSSSRIDPLLAPLALNGGTMPTHALLAGSRAIDKGESFGSTTDQRGQVRPFDNPNVAPATDGDNSDIGAFEATAFAPLVVTKTADTNDGVCDADCSLREAIAAASASGNEIIFASPLFETPQTITLSDAPGFQELTISKNLTINGKGANLLTIRRAPNATADFRIFQIFNLGNVAGDVAINLAGMTITGGSNVGGRSGLGGGGIRIGINSSVTLTGCHVTGNSTISVGAAIYKLGAGSLSIINSTVSNNTALGTFGGGFSGGGAIHVDSASALTITNSTISGNVKQNGNQNGGGIWFFGASPVITSSTITDNQADGADSASGVYSTTSHLTVRNTIIAGNRNNSTAPDVAGSFTSQGYNLIGNVGTASGFNQTGDQTGTSSSRIDPLLAPLALNGGTTPNHSFANSGSSAVDKGKSFGLTTDQRGYARGVVFFNSPAPGGDSSDIGSYEFNPLGIELVANNDSYATNEDTILTVPAPGVLANDTAVEGESAHFTAVLVTNPAHGTLTLNSNGSFTYTPAADYNGVDSFTYKVDDDGIQSNVAAVYLTVNPAQEAPVAVNDSYATNEDATLTITDPTILANDTDTEGDPLTAILVTNPAHGTLTLNSDGSFTYTPAANYNGADSFTYKANDGTANSNTATVNITVNPVNDAPVAVDDSYTTNKDTSLTIAVPGVLTNDTDVDGDALTSALVTNPAHGTLTLNSDGSFTYTPAANYNGADSFTYKANDGQAFSNNVTVNLTVTQPTVRVVTKTLDTNDGVCDADCSLREAIVTAAPGDVIEFASPLFDSPQTITLSDAAGFRELTINKNLTINGKGANLLTIQRSPDAIAEFRIFGIGVDITVNLSGMTITGGNLSGPGGGIAAFGSVVTITGCYINNNSSGDSGGGIYNGSSINNVGNLTLLNSTVSNNSVHPNGGGGIYNNGTLTVTNSTISGNKTSFTGGGIFTRGTTNIANSTITNNEDAGFAGGIFLADGTITIRNTIIAGNRNNSTAPDVKGTFLSQGYNLIGNVGTASGFNQTGDQAGTSSSRIDPLLAPLALNGGTTPTYALLANSPAIDKGNSFGSTTDQRGQVRPFDNPNVAPATDGDNSDIGAYESQQVCAALNLSPATLPSGTISAPFSQTITASGGVAPYTFAITGGTLPDGLTLSSGGTISGTPSATGTSSFTITVTDSGGCSGVLSYTLAIAKASQTITFAALSNKTYGDAPFTINAAASSGLPVSFTVLSGPASINGNTVSIAGAGTVIIRASQAGDNNYDSAPGADQEFIVGKASQTITFGALPNKTYGDSDFTVSATASSGLSVNFNAADNCTLSGNTVHLTGAGTCTITASQTGNGNYDAAPVVSQSFEIAKASQTITFGALPAKTYGDAPFNVSATGGASGNSVTFSSQTPMVCSVNGNTVTILAAGDCTIRASQAGNSNYNAAPTVDQSFEVTASNSIITLSNLMQTYDGTAKSVTVTTNPIGLKVIVTYTQNNQTVAAPINAGSYNVTATISDPNYQGSATGLLVINKATPTITWNNPASIVFGTPLSATQLNATANVPGTFTYTPPAGTVLNVGNNQLFVTFTPADTVNYANVSHSVQLTVEQITSTGINLSQPTYSAGEGDGHLAITVNRTGSGTGEASVDYKTADTAGLQNCAVTNGIASSRCDYATTVGTLRFAAGETAKTIYIPLVDDAYDEGPETFNITLSNAVGENLGAVSTATITINDNETVTAANPISTVPFFVRQQYIDFLGREPEPAGYQGWQNILNNCVSGDNACDRIAVSSGFFRSPEFQDRGYFIFRFYSAALGRNPLYAEFIPDLAKVSGFLTDAQLEANKVAFVQEFMARSEFANRYGSLSNTAFVDTLIQESGLMSHPQRGAWIDALNNRTATRAQVLRAFTESKEVYDKFYNQAFVVMQYFGYLRRDPDALYTQWIETLNRTGDYRTMINGFMNSNEYVQRFGP